MTTVTTPKPPIDFKKVEALRRHMLLTVTDMAEVLGVTRMTYYGWLKGTPPRRANDENVRKQLRRLLRVMTDHGWPTPDVIAAPQPQRKQELLKALNSLD